MEEEEKMKEENWKDKLCKNIEKYISNLSEQELSVEDINILSQLVDIHKDLKNEDYWEVKEIMYGRNYGRDSYGRDSYEESSYGRRGVPGSGRGRYRGEDMLEEMREHYGNYMEGGRGRYSGESDKAFDYMLESAKDFFMHLFEESKNQEQEEKIRRTAREISEMR